MSKKNLSLALFVLILLVTGCRQETEFVCPDGTTVESASDCAAEEEPSPEEEPEAADEEPAEAADKKALFAGSLTWKTQGSVSMSLDDYTVEDKGGWAKLTNVKFTVLNEGDEVMQPKLDVSVGDDSATSIDEHLTRDTLKLGGPLAKGEHKSFDMPVSISFRNLHIPKLVKLDLLETYGPEDITMVYIEYGFKVD